VKHANYLHLAERFFQRLLALAPASVCDVGCGSGFVVGRCFEEHIPAVGFDPSQRRLKQVRDVGFAVGVAPAYPLPLADDAVDWVAMRHVLHHTAEPARAVAEAARVARRGILFAEPWFDVRLPSQRASLRADLWSKQQDSRRGHPHHPSVDAYEILAMLPDGLEFRFETEQYFRPWPLDVADFERRAAKLGDDLPDGSAGALERDAVVAELRAMGWTDCGTEFTTVRLKAGANG
jgi:SAM-dependent methyltransferase